jgi:uncharacterized protein YuzE
MEPRVEYDPEVDALYIYLADKPYSHGRDLDDVRRIDYAADETPIGIEILYPSKGVDLQGLPAHDLIVRALEEYHFPIYA